MRRRPVFSPLVALVLALLFLHGCGAAENTNNSNAQVNPSPSPGGTPVAKIDEILDRMGVGNIAFNPPPTMKLHETREVVLLLSPKETAGQLEERLRDEGAGGNVRHATIQISDKMQAVLTGDGFQINPITTDTLPVSRQGVTRWMWQVRPQRGGELRLYLVVNAIVDLDDGEGLRPYPIQTYSQPYVVNVPWREGAVVTFFRDNWPWLWATVLLPVGALLWTRKRAKRRAARGALFRGEGGGIFISYRREDSAGHVGRLHDALASHFGADRVFRDLDSIGYGEDFVEIIEKSVGSCAVVVVVIGRQWLDIVDQKGQRRLDNPQDFVRLEIEAALRRGAKIIPALVEGASMPGEDVLPASLAKLARRNAIELSDSRWQFDVERLVEALEAELERQTVKQPETGEKT